MEEPAEIQYDIGGVFGIGAADIVIKQEPQDDVMPEDEVMESSFIAEDNCDDEHQVYPHPEEIDDVILQRAVSPPTYSDHCDPEELLLFYKEKFQLKDVTVKLENCDKIWETLQLIKNIQGDSNNDDDDSSYSVDSPKNSSNASLKSPVPTIPYQPIIGNSNKALPDFRFSVKSKKKLYHCVSCGKEFGDSQQLKQHALEDHGVYVSPKRIYKPRADQIAKSIRLSATASNEGFASELQNPDSMVKIPLSQATMQAVAESIELTQTVQSSEILNTEDTENSALGINAIVQQPPMKTRNVKLEIKEKIKCILCKRITTDIVSHMKGYHKVGCLKSIIDQCEKVTDDILDSDEIASVAPLGPVVPLEPAASVGSVALIAPVPPSSLVTEPMELDVPLTVTVRKRKRNHTRWTVPKKKFKSTATRLTRLPIDTVKVGFKKYKCDICFGIYKTPKSFSYHRKLHRMRGETPDNFDASKCRFLNSPLRTVKQPKEILNNYVESQRQSVKIQPSITNYLKSPADVTKPPLKTEEQVVLQNACNQNPVEPTVSVCECGRSFRNYHTLFLHKVKCKDIDGKGSHANDSDSGIGISIKIKKNKNDSYEVVQRTTPTDESFKESRSCKDSDASSNDSGVVSVSSNCQKADSSESEKYKTLSVMRIQVEDNDEEVDIEDENSNHSNFNGNCYTSFNRNLEDSADTASSVSTENDSLQNGIGSVKNSSNIPSLSNLCRQVLSKSKEMNEVSPHRCLTCSSYFKNTTDLMDHVSNMKHDVKSICSCDKEFKSLKYYNMHVRRIHPLLLNCNYCMTNFDRIEKYLGHKCNVMEGKLFIEPIIQTQCMKCKTLVDLGEQFDKHMKTHNSENANFYQCYKCELTFDNPYQRRSHFSKEHGFSPCRICGKVLHIDHLSKHEAYHDGLGHPCHLCKKTFSQKTLLKRHVQGTHDPLVNEVVKCIVCLKIVKLRYLKKHMSFHLHTEICKKCNKCYRSDDPNSFEEHIAIDHSDDLSTLKCETCHTTFVFDKDYKVHCQQGTCKNNANDAETVVQNATTT